MVVIAIAATSLPAAADVEQDATQLGWSWLYDGGMIPFVYGSGGVILASNLGLFAPRRTPLFFSENEGGAEPRGDTVPPVTSAVVAAVGIAAVGLVPDDARWFHLKGFIETTATLGALTRIVTVTFGRHRPDYDLEGPDEPGKRVSFFSGHAAQTVGQTAYVGLWLRFHVFEDIRGDRILPWWEALSYAGLAAFAIYVPASRVSDHRHHASDVLVGALVGATSSTAFFFWQKHRYEVAASALSRRERGGHGRFLLLPETAHPGFSVLAIW